MPNFEDIFKALVSGKESTVRKILKEMINAGVKPIDIINQGLIPGMGIVDIRFKRGEMFVHEVLMSARSMLAGIEIVKPLIVGATDMPIKGKILLGTVKGDLHDIGEKLVGMMLESRGFNVINMGVDISPKIFVEAVKKHTPDILAMSALLTTTMIHMNDTIQLLKEEGLKDKVIVIVGGGPVSQDFADAIGADGYAPEAVSAVELCEKLIG